LNEGINLPNNGTFTSFQLHIPALVSGTAEEWDRVSKLLIDAIPRVEYDVKSDMHALDVLRQEKEKHDIIFMTPKFNVLHGFQYKSFRKVNCEAMSIGRAIHFSHYTTDLSVRAGLYPLKKDEKDPHGSRRRGKAIRTFLDDWRDQCNGPVAQE